MILVLWTSYSPEQQRGQVRVTTTVSYYYLLHPDWTTFDVLSKRKSTRSKMTQRRPKVIMHTSFCLEAPNVADETLSQW
jgi:hypothetical protein